MAADGLAERGVSLKVVNLPWLNRIDLGWLEATVGTAEVAFALDNHAPYGGVGDNLLNGFMASAGPARAPAGEVRRGGVPGMWNAHGGLATSSARRRESGPPHRGVAVALPRGPTHGRAPATANHAVQVAAPGIT